MKSISYAAKSFIVQDYVGLEHGQTSAPSSLAVSCRQQQQQQQQQQQHHRLSVKCSYFILVQIFFW
jgi:hypothetical protein